MQSRIPIEAMPDAPENLEDGCFALQELAHGGFAGLPAILSPSIKKRQLVLATMKQR
jgi:hypothetical protein